MTLILNGTDNSATVPAVTGGTAGTSTGPYYPTTSQWAVSTAGTQAMLVDANQNVGVGTASPVRRLTVAYPGAAEFVLQDTSQAANSRNWRIYNASNSLVMGTLNDAGTAGNDYLKIDSSGNVGIGTTSPSVKFQVNHSSDVAAINASGGGVTLKMSNSSANDVLFRMTNNSSNFYDIRNTTGNALVFGYNGTDAMRLDSSRNLLLNTTSMPGSSNSVLGIVYTSGNGAGIQHTGSTGGAAPKVFDFVNSSNSSVGYIAVSGTGVAFTSTSDYRLKENVAPMTGALGKVMALKPVTYTWKSVPGMAGEGFIAHELAEVCPYAVHGEKDAVDADNNPVYQGIDTSYLVGTLAAAMQELKAEFDAYKATHP